MNNFFRVNQFPPRGVPWVKNIDDYYVEHEYREATKTKRENKEFYALCTT